MTIPKIRFNKTKGPLTMHNTLSEGLHKDIEYIISYLFFRKSYNHD